MMGKIQVRICMVIILALLQIPLFGQQAAGNGSAAGGRQAPTETGVPDDGQAASGTDVRTAAEGASEYLSFSLQAQLLVIDREAAADALVDWVDERGGYFIEKSRDRVVLRVPVVVFARLRETVRQVADEVVSYNVSAFDLRQEYDSVLAALKSREESLERVLGFLDSTDVSGTLALEREISGLMREIESLKGRERVLRNRMAYAEAGISLSTRDASIPGKRPSSFPWINTIDLYSFLEEQP